MWSRKIAAAAAAGVLAAALVTFPAAAHGHGHHRQASSVTCDTSCMYGRRLYGDGASHS